MRDFSFFKYPASLEKALRDLKTKPPAVWEKQGEKMALQLFRFASTTVPAYRAFLRNHDVNPKRIRTIADFKTLPIMDKNSYLRTFPYEDLFPRRDIAASTTIAATSGSSGEPFYFPRGEMQDAQYEYVAELFLKNQFEIDKKRTLAVIGFGLGIWIGGIFTYKNFNKISAKGYKLTLAPVGPNIEMYLKVIKKFGHLFDQIILMGYPPLVKDIIDQAPSHNVDWKKYNLKIMTATESFSEDFRSYISKKSFLRNPFADTLNIYGTVELGTMAHETPVANLIRSITVGDKKVFNAIFPQADRVPTLAQYHPQLCYFEEVNGEVIGSGFGSAFPLLRYSFPDKGGAMSFPDMMAKLKQVGVDIAAEARKINIHNTIMHLPFVYVYERADSTIIVRGVNIYAEHVKKALAHALLEKCVTGKCTMIKKEDKNMNEYFEVNVELKRDVAKNPALAKKIQLQIVSTLCQINSEFHDQYRSVPHIMRPPVILWPYQDPKYFQTGIKQKWVKNSPAFH